ncbi:N-6 DNA methylase [Nonomuraea fuscirosea]|uniref:N-6 DNA methylase n=1 Tax=Nonomuraea fuscirosea TaxID=1291556 RepID=UPI0034422E85
MNAPHAHVSRSDIARLAQVKRPAVSNWERRHADFPQPERVEGEDRFPVESMMRWLGQRRIPRNALLPGEQPGATFGDRFRKNLLGHSGTSDAEAPVMHEPSPAGGVEDETWRSIQRLRGPYEVAHYRDLVLSLVFLRAQEPDAWLSHAGEAHALPRLSIDALRRLRRMTDGIQRPWIGAEDWRAPSELIDVIDRAVHAFGGAEVFRTLLDRFASWEGRRGGEFYTPPSVVRTLVDALAAEPSADIYDPSCGSGEILLAAALHARETGAKEGFVVHGDALSPEALVLAEMNMTLHGVEARLHRQDEKVLERPYDACLRYPYIITNPPFSMRSWSSSDPADSAHWRYGPPPRHNADFAWLQYVLARLRPLGRAAVLMPPGAAFREGREQAIRRGMVEDGRVEALIALPPMLFYSTGIGATIWILHHPERPRREILFADATGLGRLARRNHRHLSEEDHVAVKQVLADWRAGVVPVHAMLPTAVVTHEELRDHGYNLNPSRYAARASVSTTDGGQEAVSRLRSRLDLLHEQAAEADVAVNRMMGGLSWPSR